MPHKRVIATVLTESKVCKTLLSQYNLSLDLNDLTGRVADFGSSFFFQHLADCVRDDLEMSVDILFRSIDSTAIEY